MEAGQHVRRLRIKSNASHIDHNFGRHVPVNQEIWLHVQLTRAKLASLPQAAVACTAHVWTE
jgi:hypothetical protein